MKQWQAELDTTAAKLDALAHGADEKTAEQWSKLHTDDDGQRDQFAALAQQQAAQDATIKALEDQKKIKEQLLDLTKEAAQVSMTEAQKHLDDLKRDGANAAQIAQAKQLQGIVDASERFKKDQESAKSLIESSLTPLDKFQKEAADINKLLREGLITDKQADDALDKAGKTLAKSNKDEDKHAGASTRRFDFTLPKEPKHADTASQTLQVARQQLEASKQIEYFLNQLYNFGQADQQNADEIVTF